MASRQADAARKRLSRDEHLALINEIANEASAERDAATRSNGEAAAKRVGICFNDYEMFWWRADEYQPCPACSTDDEDYEANHGYYVAEARND